MKGVGGIGRSRQDAGAPRCDEHVQCQGGENPLHNLMVVKCERTARASPVREGLEEAASVFAG